MDFAHTLYHKSLALIAIEPTGLLRELMIQHIRHGHQGISLDASYRYPEYSRAYDQSRLDESWKAETIEAWL